MDAPPPSDQPDKPPTKGVFHGRRPTKRGLSRNQKKGSNNQKKNSYVPEDESAVATSTAPSRPAASTTYTKTSKAEYAEMLETCRAELEAARADIASKDKMIAKLNNQIKKLTETTNSAREKAREAKQHATKIEKESNVATKKLKMEVASLQDQFKQSNMEWEQATNLKIDEVREAEQDRRNRAALVLQRKYQRDMKKMAKEYQSSLDEKNSELKNVKKLATASRDETSKLYLQSLRQKQAHQEALAKKDVTAAAALADQRKKSAALLQQKQQVIKQQSAELKDYQELAFEVSVEHQEMSKATAKLSKKLAAVEDVSKQRLLKSKAAKEMVDKLKGDLEETQEELGMQLIEAHEVIHELREQLARKTEEAEEFELMSRLAQEDLASFRYHKVKKIGNPKSWDPIFTQLVIEMLAHQTPPSCISANILSVVKLLIPEAPIIEELPSVRFVRNCRTVLLHLSKTLAAYEIAIQDRFLQLFTDGTTRRQTEFQNVVIGILTSSGYRRVALDSCIISEEHNAESVTSSIIVAFQRSGKLLDQWRAVTEEMYPDRPDLLLMLPSSEDLSLSKLAKGFTMTDTCNTAKRIQVLLKEKIAKVCKEKGLADNEIEIHTSYCWQHLRNVWFGAVETALNNTLVNQLEESLASIPSMYRVDMDIVTFYRGVEKMVGGTANYAKGSGKEFEFYKGEFHPTIYLYPLTRACGGTRQDLSVEGAPSILMNLPLYLQFLRWRSGVCGTSGDGILATNLQIYLRSVEVVALLRVMSILHISVCMPIRWLAGKTAELSDYDFGHYDMGKALDTLEEAFEAIIEDPSKFLDEDFMMGLFSEISDKVDPFKAYLAYMFEEKLGNVVENTKDDEEKVLPYDEIRAAVFYPTRKDIMQTDELCRELAVTAATAFLVEFRDESKATSNYLSSIGGQSSLAVLTESQRKSGIGKESSNSTSESLHGTTTDILKRTGTIRLDHAAGDGMIKYNRHTDRDVEQYIKGTKPSAKKDDAPCGLFFTLPKELQISAVTAAKRGSKNLKKEHDQALESQKRADLARKQAEQMQIIEKAKEAYIRAWKLIEIYRSERGWKTLSQSWRTFNQLSSESARLRAVKEQIVIRWKGFGWDEAAHAWSKDQRPYSSLELMKHFVEVVLPMEKDGVPEKPLLRFQDNTTKYTLGTRSALEVELLDNHSKTAEEIEGEAMLERARREMEGETDLDASRQTHIMPNVDDNLVGFNIEFCFSYVDEDGGEYLAWIDGVVERIVNAEKRMVEIRWNEQKVHEDDVKVSRHKLQIRKWNAKKVGAWRKYLGDQI